jgi:hypothetical protein
MRRTGVLLAAIALLATGCGSSKGSPASAPSTPSDHADTAAQTAVLSKALASFKAAGTVRYESEVTADDVTQPLAHETGSVRLKPVAAEFERAILGIDPTSSAPTVKVVRVRSIANTKSFLQLKEWGSWTGCWLKTDLSAIKKLTGVEISKSDPLPTAVGVLAKAKVVGAGDGLDGPHLAVDGYSALQFLGVAGSAIAPGRDALSRVVVPVLLDVTADGAPSGASVEGSQVAAALRTAGVQLAAGVTDYLGKAHARVVFTDLGKPVQVQPPPAAEQLPRHPATTSTCPANKP